MAPNIRKWLGVALAIFVVAVVVSVATDDTISDIGFFVYAAALIAIVVLLVVALAGYLRDRGQTNA